MAAEVAPLPTEPDQNEQPPTPPKLTVLSGGLGTEPTRAETEPEMTEEELSHARQLLADAGHADRVTDERFIKNFARAYFYASKEAENQDQFTAALKYAELKTPNQQPPVQV